MPPPLAHSRHTAAPAPLPGDDSARARGIQRAALVALITNALLTVGQVIVGLFAGAFSLVADAAHTLSDLITDALVLMAGRHSADPADLRHPYGHARVETVASFILGLVLGGVGLGFLWSSGIRLQHMDQLPALHPAALGMAVGAGEYFVAIIGSGVVLIVLTMLEKAQGLIERWHQSRTYRIGFSLQDDCHPFIEQILTTLKLSFKRRRDYKDTNTFTVTYDVFGPEDKLDQFNLILKGSDRVLTFGY